MSGYDQFQRHEDGGTDFEQRVRAAFDESVASMDAATLSRLRRARHQALDATAKAAKPAVGWRTFAPVGALAAGVLAAALLLRMPTDDTGRAGATASRAPQSAAQEPLELLAAGEDFELATAEEDLDFYAWIELAAEDVAAGVGQS